MLVSRSHGLLLRRCARPRPLLKHYGCTVLSAECCNDADAQDTTLMRLLARDELMTLGADERDN